MELSQRRRRLVARLRHRKTRVREGRVLVEGIRAVETALDAGARVDFAVVGSRLGGDPRGRALRDRLAEQGVEICDIEDDTLAELADTENPQGVLVVCTEPDAPEGTIRKGGRYLVLDAVQDPGNVGTLVRAAAAFALDGVVALDGCADPWSAKAVRASAGLSFALPVLTCDAGALMTRLAEVEVPLLVADATGEDVVLRNTGGFALVVANEGRGPRPSLTEGAASRVRIPMRGAAESLNAAMAGSILLYALTREDTGAA